MSALLPSEVADLQQGLGTSPRRGVTYLFHGSLHELLHPPPNQIPFLHGVRATAILLVIAFHSNERYVSAHGENAFSRLPFISNGWIGVDLFFVLSGFFIGGQLWKELWATGSISLRHFILRRGLRIWPLYFATFIAALVLSPHNAASHGYGWSDVVFLTNFVQHGGRLVGNVVPGAWSLCVEEQFYLFAPLLLLLVPRFSPAAILGGILALPIVRATIWLSHAGSLSLHDSVLFFTSIYFQWHWDGLLVGLLIARQWISRGRPQLSRGRASSLLLGALIVFAVLHHLHHEILTFSGLAVACGAVVWAGLTTRTTFFTHPAFYWISRLSFGMYLNHQFMIPFVLGLHLPGPQDGGSSPLAQVLFTVILTLLSAALAAVTFCVIEHPALSLRVQLLQSSALHTDSKEHAAHATAA